MKNLMIAVSMGFLSAVFEEIPPSAEECFEFEERLDCLKAGCDNFLDNVNVYFSDTNRPDVCVEPPQRRGVCYNGEAIC